MEEEIIEKTSKTLIIARDGYPGMVVLHSLSTKHRFRPTIMKCSGEITTEITGRIFAILKENGLPVAYQKRLFPDEILAKRCQMIPLKVVAYRYPTGAILIRYPDLEEGIFPVPLLEISVKTKHGKILDFHGNVIGELPEDPKTNKPIENPFIHVPQYRHWSLKHPEKSFSDPTILEISANSILPRGVSIQQIDKVTIEAFKILEETFSKLKLRLISFEIEFGIGPDGELLIADVIDDNSLHLQALDFKPLSEQISREAKDLASIWSTDAYILHKLQGL